MAPTPKTLSPTLQRAIGRDRRTTSERSPAALSPAEVADLKAVVRHEIAPAESFSMVRALRTLAWTERTPEVAGLLSGVLADEKEPANARAAAAIELRHLPAGEAQKGLVAGLKIADAQVQHQVLKSLGIVGDERALRDLDAMAEPKLATLRRQLAFARALIAHRHGLARDDLPFQPGVERAAAPGAPQLPLTLRPVPKEALGRERKALLGTTYGIEVGDRAFTLRCGKAEWTVFINNQLGATALLERLFERRWITGLLARREPLTGDLAVQYVLLSTPRGGDAELQVVRSDGAVLYSGRASPGRDLLQFSIQDVDRKGTAPANVRGRLTPGGVEIDAVVASGRRQDASSGHPIAG